MKLDTLYSLRKNFTIIGITGRIGSGCSEVAKLLADKDFIKNIHFKKVEGYSSKNEKELRESDISRVGSQEGGLNEKITEKDSSNVEDIDCLYLNNAEDIKTKICYDYLSHEGNFLPFEIIEYKSIILLHLLHESIRTASDATNIDSVIKRLISIIGQNGKSGEFKDKYINRFDIKDNFDELKRLLVEERQWFTELQEIEEPLNDYLKKAKKRKLYHLYFKKFKIFSDNFFNLLFSIDATKRSRLLHDLGNHLRCYGTVINRESHTDTKHIYTVAETINYIIKLWKKFNSKNITKIVIDSLKNSLELMYFKEKYSAFYMLSTNKTEDERLKSLVAKIKLKSDDIHFKEIIKLDDAEYSGSSFNKGEFGYPDIENCIQKSEYHLSLDNKIYSLNRQLIKLLALIHQPGIITPSSVERCMQVAFNAKLNSGCISRQVGAVVTDANFSVKAIGWNDVAEKQLPCNLRNVKDLYKESSVTNSDHFSTYEREGKVDIGNGKTELFKNLVKSDYATIDDNNLEGRNCSYCFKSHQNAYENEKNQVHTRSLHAEENAMMQIVKYGGEALQGGNLFTTASPCELCSKKAYQLGIKNIYYVDPYPGIATKHILTNGLNDSDNPKLRQFYGAVGRTFQKLYDPFMAYKDELLLLTKISPNIPEKLKSKKIGHVLLANIKDSEIRNKFEDILKEEDAVNKIVALLEKGMRQE